MFIKDLMKSGEETIKIIESWTFEDFEKVLIEILLGG